MGWCDWVIRFQRQDRNTNGNLWKSGSTLKRQSIHTVLVHRHTFDDAPFALIFVDSFPSSYLLLNFFLVRVSHRSLVQFVFLLLFFVWRKYVALCLHAHSTCAQTHTWNTITTYYWQVSLFQYTTVCRRVLCVASLSLPPHERKT